MGCGNSKVDEIQKKSDDANYNALMDKNIPQYFIEDSTIENNIITDDENRVDSKNDDVIFFNLFHRLW